MTARGLAGLRTRFKVFPYGAGFAIMPGWQYIGCHSSLFLTIYSNTEVTRSFYGN